MRFMIRLTSLTALFLALLTGATLFWVSQQVQQVEREQRQLIAANSQEEESIRVLRAEWDYLNRPERLEQLSAKYLNMAPVSADTLIQSISAIPEPEEPSLAPEEHPVEISTSAPKVVEKPTIKLVPPVLSGSEAAQEKDFGKVIDGIDGEGE